MFSFFLANNFISRNQFSLKPGDLRINQLLLITHEIYISYLDRLEAGSVFLDISKALDKNWHEGLILKLKQNGVSGELLHLLSDILGNRKQRVVLNDQNSSWTNVHAGVPQGSILGPLLFLVHRNDLPDNFFCNVKRFVDDTSIFSLVHDVDTKQLNDNLKKKRIVFPMENEFQSWFK